MFIAIGSIFKNWFCIFWSICIDWLENLCKNKLIRLSKILVFGDNRYFLILYFFFILCEIFNILWNKVNKIAYNCTDF